MYRPIGGDAVMVRQLERRRETTALPTVSLRVVPFSAGLHHGVMSGPFEILRFPLNGNGQDIEPPTVYVEGFTGALYLDKARDVDRYDTAFTNVWLSSAAATPTTVALRSPSSAAGTARSATPRTPAARP